MYDADAEFANVDEKYLISVPHGLDNQKACALIRDWTTAYGMVHRSAKVRAGQKVSIHGLSGAIGLAAATLCQVQGAQVYGTASKRHHDTLRLLGFEPVLYTDKNWMSAMIDLGGADAAFDPPEYEFWDESYSILSHNDACLVGYGHNVATKNGEGRCGGKFVSTDKLLSRNLMCSMEHRHTKFFYITKDDKTVEPELQTLFDLPGQGKIDVKIKGIFDLEDICEAHHNYIKGSSGIGSMLLNVGDKSQ